MFALVFVLCDFEVLWLCSTEELTAVL